ncbi:hypothetical protein ABPG74_022364 [Tetrahymena malaccensis]
MGQCCGFVKTENGINMHQAQFSREIEEHLDKLEKDRIIEAQETSSQIGNIGNNNGPTAGYHDGKDIGAHQSNLSNEIQKQRSADKQLLKKESAYEDYEVKVIENQNAQKEQNQYIGQNSTGDKVEKYNSQTSKDLARIKSSEKKNSVISKQESMNKQGTLSNNLTANNQALGIEEIHLEQLSVSPNNSYNYASNEESLNNSVHDEETKHAENQNGQAVNGGVSFGNDLNKKSSLSAQLQPNILNQNGISQSNPASPSLNSGISSSNVRESFQNNGGRKSILLNTLAKKDDPNSGSKSILTSEDQQEKKKEKRVKLVTTQSEKRFDTDTNNARENTEKTTPSKPKGVLKKYDPNSSFSDADSPRTKTKKKVKFKESTFKKQSKKKKKD